MSIKKIFSGFVVLAVCFPVLAAEQCAKVDCDCEAIAEVKWRGICENREKTVVEECQTNNGTPKSYCGLHGPAAYPVAISLKTAVSLGNLSDADLSVLDKQINTQDWSLLDSYKMMKAKEESANFGEALQILGLYERDVDRLYELQKQKILLSLGKGDSADARRNAQTYGQRTLATAASIDTYSQALWQKKSTSDDARAQKAYKILSLKLARLAANVFEQGADLLGSADLFEPAALAWQQAAGVAKRLMDLEASTENKAKHVEFYQAQVSARLHRATYCWLQTKSHTEQVLQNLRIAEGMGTPDDDQAIADLDSTHDIDSQDVRAMKRPGR